MGGRESFHWGNFGYGQVDQGGKKTKFGKHDRMLRAIGNHNWTDALTVFGAGDGVVIALIDEALQVQEVTANGDH